MSTERIAEWMREECSRLEAQAAITEGDVSSRLETMADCLAIYSGHIENGHHLRLFPPPIDIYGALAQCAPAPWLLKRTKELVASPDLLDHIVAVGLIGRLAAGSTIAARTMLRKVLNGEETPHSRALAWTSKLNRGMRNEIVRRATERGDRLRDDLDDLDDKASVSMCLQRDDLESVAWVLRSHGNPFGIGTEFECHLDSLDERSEPHGLDAAASFHLHEVSWQEPEAWWGIA